MSILEYIDFVDKEWLLAINGLHSSFFDGFMYWITDRLVWIPLYVSILWSIVKARKLEIIAVIAAVIFTVLLADQFASGFCKPFFMRYRPANNPELYNIVHIVNGMRGDLYGFCSSHAANTVGLATILSLIIRKRTFSITMFGWALANCYSRAYLAMHYPMDLLCGAIAGAIFAVIAFYLYKWLLVKFSMLDSNKANVDCRFIYVVMSTTLFVIILFASRGFIA